MPAGFSLIQPGSTITRVYYTVPGHTGDGDKIATWDEAVAAAKDKYVTLVDQIASHYPNMTPEAAREVGHDTAKPQVVIDLRWYIAAPAGGGTDMVVERWRFADLPAAREVLA